MTKKSKKKPWLSIGCISLLMLGCFCAELIMTKDPTYLDLSHVSVAPCREFLFGTDTLGRDIFSMIWYGGRISIVIGVLSTVISSAIAIIYGTISGMAGGFVDAVMMRITEVLLSVPNLLFVLFLQAMLGSNHVLALSVVIGVTSWFSLAKIVRAEVQTIRESEYVLAAKSFGGSFFHLLRTHFMPNFMPGIYFMIVMNVRGAIVAESTLSFMGLGLPLEIITWGSMLSLAENAMLTKGWWMIVIPGAVLVLFLYALTEIGNYLRK